MKKGFTFFSLLVVLCLCYSFFPVKRDGRVYSFTGQPKTPAQLGEVLFFEPALSLDSSRSCSSCHIPEFAFSDTVAFSIGVGGKLGKRNAPSCANMADRSYLFYDGRAATLEEQVRFPVEDKNEMGNTMAEVTRRLKHDKKYVEFFRNIYHRAPNDSDISASIAAYERTLETSKTPFDRYMVNEDSTLVSAAVLRGRELFFNRARCFQCHFTPDFTGDEFRNIGLFNGREFNDSGRYLITHNKGDIGKFKVPGLRNVAVTGPYMHNGMFTTLAEVIEYYDNPGKFVQFSVGMDSLLQQPLHLSQQEKSDLEAFLVALTDDRFAAHIRKR